jgi:hypothetical protein
MTWLRTYRVVAACCLCSAVALDFAPTARAQTKPPTVLDNPLAGLSLDRLAATRERPLFSPSRRAPSPPVVFVRPPAIQPPAPPPNLELYGTIINADDALAIVFSSSTNQTTRVHVGDEIGGWKVDNIDERKLVLSLDKRIAVFTIFGEKTREKAVAEASGSVQEEQEDQPEPPPMPGRSGAPVITAR